MIEEVKAALTAFEGSIEGIGGCGDSSCLVRPSAGMVTNGGCKCFDREPFKAKQVAMSTRRLHKALRAIVQKATP